MSASPSSQPDPTSSLTCTAESVPVGGTTATVLVVAGEVDIATDGTLGDALSEVLTRRCAAVVVDLTEVPFCSAGGFAMLVDAARSVAADGGRFAVVSSSGRIARLCARLWPPWSASCHRDMAAALAAVRPGARRGPSEPSGGSVNDRDVDDLLVSVGHGDLGALGDFYEITVPAVFGLLRRVHLSREAAERATQEVYLRIWRTAPRFDPDDGTAYSLLMRTARRQVARRLTTRLSWGAHRRASERNSVDEQA